MSKISGHSIWIKKSNYLNDYFDIKANIKIDNSYTSNKNLISDKLFKAIELEQPIWDDLINQLKNTPKETLIDKNKFKSWKSIKSSLNWVKAHSES